MTHLIDDIGRSQRQDVHMIWHIGFVDHVDNGLAGQHIADTGRSQTISLGEGPGNDEVRMILQQADRRAAIELDISFIDEEGAVGVDVVGNILDIADRKAIAGRIVRVAEHGQAGFILIHRVDELLEIERVIGFQRNRDTKRLGSFGIDPVHRERRLRIDDLLRFCTAKAVEQLLDNLARAAADEYILFLQAVILCNLLTQGIIFLIRIAVVRDPGQTPHQTVFDHWWQIHVAFVGVDFDGPVTLHHIIGWHIF